VTQAPQYRQMDPSPPRSPGPPLPPFGVPYNPRTQVNLGWLAGPPEGITPSTVARPKRTPETEEERGSPVVEPPTRGTTDLTINDRLGTPHLEHIHHHPHRTRQTPTLMSRAPVHHQESHHLAIESSTR
jgi:hypothetical protein